MFIPVHIGPSAIFGNGLFSDCDVKRGTIVCSFTTDSTIITETDYLAAIRAEEYLVVRTGTRYAGKYFTIADHPDLPLNFFNHSFEPNLLSHCGLVIAKRDIAAGAELTVDYRYLIDDTQTGVYNDAISGRPIRGFCARQTLLRTARELIEMLEKLDDTWDG